MPHAEKMTETIQLLDHGYVKLVETYGSDERIIEAARMSVNKGFLGWEPGPCEACIGTGQVEVRFKFVARHGTSPANTESCRPCEGKGKLRGDKHLLRFLWEKKHSTPFEMAGAIFEVQAPIFVYREWHRHRTQSYAEMSARYTPLPDVNYIPTVERLMRNAGGSNKQAGTIKGSNELTEAKALQYIDRLHATYADDEAFYQDALNNGVPKELARNHLPVGRYSRMRAHANLRNWLAFLTLRKHPAAQWEIQQYAIAVHTILTKHFPRTLELFDEGMAS